MNDNTLREEFIAIVTEHPEIVPDLLLRARQYMRDQKEKEENDHAQ